MDGRCRIEPLGQLRVTQGERETTRFRIQKRGALLGYVPYQPCKDHLLPPSPPPLCVGGPTHLTCLTHGCFIHTPTRPHVADQVEDRSYGAGPRRE